MLLKDLRERCGLTQTDLANAVGVHGTYVSLIEGGLRRPSVPVLDRMLRVLKASDAERSEALAQAAAEPAAPAVAA